jgi:hypothetical protein
LQRAGKRQPQTSATHRCDRVRAIADDIIVATIGLDTGEILVRDTINQDRNYWRPRERSPADGRAPPDVGVASQHASG